MKDELISVVVPVFNAEKFIGDCLNSLQTQTYKNLEIICIDDASTDNTVSVINSIRKHDARIKLLLQPENGGISTALNRGIAEAKGRYIARMDSDDRTLPERIEWQKSVLDADKSIGIIGSWIQLFGDESAVWHYRQSDEFIRALFLFRSNGVPHNSILVRKDIYDAFQYDPYFDGVEDTELWCRIIKSKPEMRLANIPKVLTYYRKHQQQTSSHRARHQMVLYKEIIKDYLAHFCGDISEEQLQLHYHLIEPKNSLDVTMLQKTGEWKQALLLNYEKKFKDAYFAIEEKWFRLCSAQNSSSAMEIYEAYSDCLGKFEFLSARNT